MAWRDRRLLQCLGLRSSLIQAPMANAQARDMVIDAVRLHELSSSPEP